MSISQTQDENSCKLGSMNTTFLSINGNADFSSLAQQRGWTGNGTSSNPYIIEDLIVEANSTTKYLLMINNTNVYFQIRNCRLTGKKGYGYYNSSKICILFSNVTNGLVLGNYIDDFYYHGLSLINCTNIEITDNTFKNAGGRGFISITHSSNISLTKNVLFSSYQGIIIQASFDIQIKSNHISRITCQGIFLNYSESITIENNILESAGNGYGTLYPGLIIVHSHSNTIKNNSIVNPGWAGIALLLSDSNILNNNLVNYTYDWWYEGINLKQSNNNTLSENYLQNCKRAIELTKSNGTVISHNSVLRHGGGISIYTSTENLIQENNLYEADTGVSIWGGGKHTILMNQFNNCDVGIRLTTSSYNTIVNNTLTRNHYHGIILSEANFNVLCGNTISMSHKYGIYLEQSNHNTLTRNIITGNEDHGLYLDTSEYNNITENIITMNQGTGLVLDNSPNNTVVRNQIYWNAVDVNAGIQIILILLVLGFITFLLWRARKSKLLKYEF
ncbi:MAG: right-handed parallel beta-helix repeat-containing protein [Promethearchaeota archaeon]